MVSAAAGAPSYSRCGHRSLILHHSLQGAPTDWALSSESAATAGAGAVPRFAGGLTDVVRVPTAMAQVAAAACAPAPACVAAAKSAGPSGNVTVAAAPGASVTFWKPLQGFWHRISANANVVKCRSPRRKRDLLELPARVGALCLIGAYQGGKHITLLYSKRAWSWLHVPDLSAYRGGAQWNSSRAATSSGDVMRKGKGRVTHGPCNRQHALHT